MSQSKRKREPPSIAFTFRNPKEAVSETIRLLWANPDLAKKDILAALKFAYFERSDVLTMRRAGNWARKTLAYAEEYIRIQRSRRRSIFECELSPSQNLLCKIFELMAGDSKLANSRHTYMPIC